jgi:hypothetical protein
MRQVFAIPTSDESLIRVWVGSAASGPAVEVAMAWWVD